LLDDQGSPTSGASSIEFTPAQEAAILTRFQDYMRQHQDAQIRLEPSFETPASSSNIASAQAVQTILPPEVVTPGLAATQTPLCVDEKKYKLTSQDILASIRACKISSNSYDNKKKIKTFLDNMKSTGLYTLIIGERLIPVCSETNPHGFVPRRATIMNDPTSVQNQDDFYHWNHDSQRTFMLCMEFFDTTLHYHCKEDIIRCDGVAMYRKLMKIVDGKFLKDIEKARKDLYDGFAISPAKPIAHELDRLQTCINNFEYAQDAWLTERQKMDLLSIHIYKDPRPIIVSALLTARSLNKTYEQAKEEIIDTCNNLPPGIATIKMANVNVAQEVKDQKVQHCYGFAQGKCRFGDKCRFQHSIDPAAKIAAGKKEAYVKDKKMPPIKDYSKIRLDPAAHALVGPPRGRPHEMNKRGYSIKQKEQINIILSQVPDIHQEPNPPPAAFSSWGTQDMHEYMTESRPDHIFMNSLRVRSDDITPDEDTNITPFRSSIQPSVTRCDEQSTNHQYNHTTPDSDSSSKLYHVNVLTVKDEVMRLNSMSIMSSVIFDSGATKSGTCHRSLMKNIKPCQQLTVQGPFGASISPKEEGLLTTLDIPCIHIAQLEGTILSVSDLCKKDIVLVFTSEGCRGFKAQTVGEALKLMDNSGVEVMRGLQENGLYVQRPLPTPSQAHAPPAEEMLLQMSPPIPFDPLSSTAVRTQWMHDSIQANVAARRVPGAKIFYKNVAPTSLYDQVHHALGHPGLQGMAWHKKHTIGADYTDEDAAQVRSLCKGCIEGGMRQMPTDHRRGHRPRPTEPGQQFSCDAFQCKTPSARGFHYCDLFTDLCTRIVYPVFTKTRSAEELCRVISLLFDAHPTWKPNRDRNSRSFVIDDDAPASPPECDRFIRLDAEASYRSAEFQAMAHHYGYRIERTPPRDKHAGGIAERTVGLITLKANVAMLAPVKPVPLSFWDLAMSYACQTQSFSFSSVLGTSPYNFLTKAHVNMKHLHPFWSSCYVHIPLKNGGARSGYPVLIRPASLATAIII
jgi:hypothetical protein